MERWKVTEWTADFRRRNSLGRPDACLRRSELESACFPYGASSAESVHFPRRGEPHAGLEDEQIEILARLKAALRIPFSVKLSVFYTNPLNVIRRMDDAGASGFVLFNRMVEPDIDIPARSTRHC